MSLLERAVWDFDPFGARDDMECPPSAADGIENDGVMNKGDHDAGSSSRKAGG